MKFVLFIAPLFCTLPAFASAPAPLPIAGAAGGPIGLGVAVVGYGAYWFYKKQQDK